MRSLMRWAAAVVAIVAGIGVGAGTANAATTHSAAKAPAAHTAQHVVHPMDWWW